MKLFQHRSLIPSTLFGAAVASAVWLGIGAFNPPSPTAHPFHVQLDPDADSIVRVTEGTPYVVPPHRIFCLKVVINDNLSPVHVLIDGVTALTVLQGENGQNVLAIPLPVRAGHSVSLQQDYATPALVVGLGYLSPD